MTQDVHIPEVQSKKNLYFCTPKIMKQLQKDLTRCYSHAQNDLQVISAVSQEFTSLK